MIESTQLERIPQARVADVVGQLGPAALVERDLREAIESRSGERIEAVLERKKRAPA